MMQELDKFVGEIQSWMEQHAIDEKSREAFFAYFAAYQREEPEDFAGLFPEFERTRLTTGISQVSVAMPLRPTLDWPGFMKVRLPIIYNHQQVGWHEPLFRLSDGEQFTDYTHHDVHKHHQNKYHRIINHEVGAKD